MRKDLKFNIVQVICNRHLTPIEQADSIIDLLKGEMVDFHIGVMKKGFIEEWDKNWKKYLPLIKKVAENHYNDTIK